MKTLITSAVVVAVLALFAGAAQADCHGHGYGYGHVDHYHVQPHFVQPHLHFHDTSHWDYIPPQIVGHGCHQHVIPGCWVFHQDGHYDLHW